MVIPSGHRVAVLAAVKQFRGVALRTQDTGRRDIDRATIRSERDAVVAAGAFSVQT